MIAKAFSQVSQFAGLNHLIRTLFLWIFIVGLQMVFYSLSYSQGIHDIIDFLKRVLLIIPGELNFIGILVVIGIFFFLDIILKSALSFTLPLFTGQILPLGLLKKYHRKRREKLEEKTQNNDAVFNYIYSHYPQKEPDVGPTLLANIIIAAEHYPSALYKIRTEIIWPRLYQILPQDKIFSITEEKENLLFYLNLSVISILTPLVWVVVAILFQVSPPWWLFIACILLTWIFYRLSIKRALSYSKLFRVYFDLYRLDLLKKIGEEKVENMHEEIQEWDKICQFLGHYGVPAKGEDLKDYMKRSK